MTSLKRQFKATRTRTFDCSMIEIIGIHVVIVLKKNNKFCKIIASEALFTRGGEKLP